MKRHKCLSWVLSVVMALTVFVIPTGAFAEESNGDINTSARQLCWWIDSQGDYAVVKDNPTLDTAKLRENVGVIQICKWNKYAPDQYEWQIDENRGYIKWTSDNSQVAGLFDFGEGVKSELTTSEGDDPEVEIAPRGDGKATITAELYDENDQLIDTLSVTIEVTQDAVDTVNTQKCRYYLYGEEGDMGPYLGDADYDSRQLYIELPYTESFNLWMRETGWPELSPDELDGLEISGKVGTQPIAKKGADADEYGELVVPFSKVAAGTAVTVNFKLGGVTRTLKTIVTRWIDPKVTAKNYTYDGKTHKASPTVKFGKETISSKTFTLSSKSAKTVGTWKYTVESKRTSKYQFYSTGYFKINPRGTYLKTPKRAKKAFTATWAKQAAKMSTSRITGYQLQYSTSSKFTKATTKLVTVKGYATTSKKIKKLKKKKTYYVRVRTYKKVGKTTYYSTWSKAKAVKTK